MKRYPALFTAFILSVLLLASCATASETEIPPVAEILVGHTGHPESAQALEGLGYGDYVIKQIGSKLVINAWDPGNLAHAVNSLLADWAEIDPGYCRVSAGIAHTATANAILQALPIYRDEDLPAICPTGSDNHLVRIESTTPEAYAAYCADLEAAGFTRYTEHTAAKNEFSTYTNDQYVINVGFYDYYDEVRIIIEPTTALPPRRAEGGTGSVQPSFTAIGLEFYYDDPDKPLQNGQSFIWQLSDGSFVILDGGVNRNYDSKTLYEFMREHAPDPNNIVVSAWILTHCHSDHQGGFISFCSTYYINRVTVKHVLANYPSDEAFITGGSSIRGVTDLYSFAAAPVVLWPSGQRAYNAYYAETRNAHALNLPTTKEIFVSGSRITTLLLPYTAGTSGQESILK